MQQLPPNEAGPGPLEFIMRLVMGIVTIVIVAAMVAFGAVIIGAVLLVAVVAAVWVRWKAAREGLEWRTWLMRRMTRGVRAGVQAGWQEARKPDVASGSAEASTPDFYTTITTIEGEYAVLDEAGKQAASADKAAKTDDFHRNS